MFPRMHVNLCFWQPELETRKWKKKLKILLKFQFLQVETFQRRSSEFDKSKLGYRVFRNKINKKNLYQPGIISVHHGIIEKLYCSLTVVFLQRYFNSTPLYPWFYFCNLKQYITHHLKMSEQSLMLNKLEITKSKKTESRSIVEIEIKIKTNYFKAIG